MSTDLIEVSRNNLIDGELYVIYHNGEFYTEQRFNGVTVPNMFGITNQNSYTLLFGETWIVRTDNSYTIYRRRSVSDKRKKCS